MKTLGQMAFEAYCEAKRGVTYDNKPIPEWTALSDDVRAGWEAAAQRIVNHVDPRQAHTADPREAKPL